MVEARGMQKGTEASGIRALRQAIRQHFRTQCALAAAVGVTPQAVSDVLRRGKRVPAEWCVKLEQATGGAVRACDLRADLYSAPRQDKGEQT
jgi:DNA-binding transcriptional regulator YdaS (Cro superfamily)